MDSETRPIPLSALRFTVGDFDLGNNGDDAKTAPFRMVARSGKPIDHWFWGRVVHDLSGMQHKNRVPIDYVHDDKEVIGYANHFDVTDGDLVVSGALVPYKDNDRASEIVHKFRSGVPYEASINFGGDGIEIENIPEGTTADVNGYSFSGPGVIVRHWPLRGIAVCPYGADANTTSEFSNDKTVNVRYRDMANQKPEAAQLLSEDPSAVEGAPVEDTAETEAPAEETAAEVVEAEPTPEATDLRQEGKRFVEKFGDIGAVWFVDGLSFDEARDKYEEDLVRQIEDLKSKLAVQTSGESEPASYSEAKPLKSKNFVRIAGRKYE